MIKVTVKDREALRLMIARKGMSLREFSKEIGVSQAYLSQILNGTHTPSPKTCRKIAEGLGLNMEDIFLIEVIEKINHN